MSLGSAVNEMTVPPGGPTCRQFCAFEASAKTDADIAIARNNFLHLHAILPERLSAYKSRFQASLENVNPERCCTKGQNTDNALSVLVLSQGETFTTPPQQLFFHIWVIPLRKPLSVLLPAAF